MSGVVATYQTYGLPNSFEKKAEDIALGLTIGSWTSLPLLEQQQLHKNKGQAIAIREFPHERHPLNTQLIKAELEIFFPSANFSNDIPAILTTIFGKLSLDGEIKLVDIQLSPDLLQQYPGPKFGISSIRQKLNVTDRPLLMSIFKGVIGRDLDFLEQQLRAQALGGVDLIKDDEILFDNEQTPFEQRILSGKRILKEVYETTGHRTLYAVNLTGRTKNLVENARLASDLGADALLFNVHTYGFDTLQTLAEDPNINLPIMAHPALSGTFISSPTYGIEAKVALGSLLRMAGADFSLFPSPYGTVAMDRQKTLDIAAACRVEIGFKQTFPVPSAGIHPGLVPKLIHDFGVDSIINAGGGIHGHLDGAIGGGRAFRDAIDGVLQGQELEEIAKNSEALAKALNMWVK